MLYCKIVQIDNVMLPYSALSQQQLPTRGAIVKCNQVQPYTFHRSGLTSIRFKITKICYLITPPDTNIHKVIHRPEGMLDNGHTILVHIHICLLCERNSHSQVNQAVNACGLLTFFLQHLNRTAVKE